MLPEADREDFDRAVEALSKRFKPVDIEELRGLEFHHKSQGDETVEQLGISLQQLGRKAFPSMLGKEFDRLLKGRFFQALNVKWQRKLGAPKPEETFYDLYDRARALESREKQYSAGMQRAYGGEQLPKVAHSYIQKGGQKNQQFGGNEQENGSASAKPNSQSGKSSSSNSVSTHQCQCKATGHIMQNCPQTAEASGRHGSTTSVVKSVQPVTPPVEPPVISDSVTVEQLEEVLAQQKLQQEQQGLNDSIATIATNLVESSCQQTS